MGVRAARASGVGSESAGLGSCAAPASARPAGAEAIGDAEGRSGLNALGEMAVCSMASAEWWHVDDALGKRKAIPRCNTNRDAMFTKAEVTAGFSSVRTECLDCCIAHRLDAVEPVVLHVGRALHRVRCVLHRVCRALHRVSCVLRSLWSNQTLQSSQCTEP